MTKTKFHQNQPIDGAIKSACSEIQQTNSMMLKIKKAILVRLISWQLAMKMIQDWLGHSDIGTTANIYSHIDSESKKASAMAIGTALG